LTPKAWSFSALTSYETCPKKYWEESVAKNIPYEVGEVQQYGIDGHKHFEDRILKGKKLPMDLTHHEATLAKLAGADGEILGEQKMALTRDLQPTGYFDKDVWVRGQADLMIITGKPNQKTALVVDWKFGKPTPPDKPGRFDQLELMAMMFAQYHPDVVAVEGAYYWAKEKRFDPNRIHRDYMKVLWSKFLPRVERFEEAFKKDEFPAKENGLCKKWCKVKSCPFNGG
jgi:hypothetical protein